MPSKFLVTIQPRPPSSFQTPHGALISPMTYRHFYRSVAKLRRLMAPPPSTCPAVCFKHPEQKPHDLQHEVGFSAAKTILSKAEGTPRPPPHSHGDGFFTSGSYKQARIIQERSQFFTPYQWDQRRQKSDRARRRMSIFADAIGLEFMACGWTCGLRLPYACSKEGKPLFWGSCR